MCTGQEPSDLNPLASLNDDAQGSVSPWPPLQSTPTQLRALASSSRNDIHTAIETRQTLADWTDDALKKLVRQCRDSSPSKRPPMISVVLALQQIKSRHVLPAMQLHFSPQLAAPLLPYSPRKAITPSASSTPEMRVRQRLPHTLSVQPATPSTNTRRQSPYQRRPQEFMTPQDDFLTNLQKYLVPNPGHSRERSPPLSFNSPAYRDVSQDRQRPEDIFSNITYGQSMTSRDHPPGDPYHLPRESPSLRSWAILPPLASTTTKHSLGSTYTHEQDSVVPASPIPSFSGLAHQTARSVSSFI